MIKTGIRKNLLTISRRQKAKKQTKGKDQRLHNSPVWNQKNNTKNVHVIHGITGTKNESTQHFHAKY